LNPRTKNLFNIIYLVTHCHPSSSAQYAEGVGECDFVLMLLAACRDMAEDERTICTKEMVKGFNDACLEAGTSVTVRKS